MNRRLRVQWPSFAHPPHRSEASLQGASAVGDTCVCVCVCVRVCVCAEHTLQLRAHSAHATARRTGLRDARLSKRRHTQRPSARSQAPARGAPCRMKPGLRAHSPCQRSPRSAERVPRAASAARASTWRSHVSHLMSSSVQSPLPALASSVAAHHPHARLHVLALRAARSVWGRRATRGREGEGAHEPPVAGALAIVRPPAAPVVIHTLVSQLLRAQVA